MKRKIKKLIIIVLICLIPICSLHILFTTDFDRERTEKFDTVRDSFNQINDLVMEAVEKDENVIANFDGYGEIGYGVCHRDGVEGAEVVGLYEFPMELTENQIAALNDINDLMRKDLEYIRVWDDQISYEGDGFFSYVYSINGFSPKFHCHNPGVDISRQKLGGNWYCFRIHGR